MKSVAEIWRDDPDLAIDLLEERAAIIQEGEHCSQYMAEMQAAMGAGFNDWWDAMGRIKERKRKMKA